MNTFIFGPKSYVRLLFISNLTSTTSGGRIHSYPRAGPLKVISNFFVAADGKTVPSCLCIY